jgi:hypothetical protein
MAPPETLFVSTLTASVMSLGSPIERRNPDQIQVH